MEYVGEAYVNRFPADRLLNALAGFEDAEVVMAVGAQNDPITFVPVSKDAATYLTLVMSYG